MGYKDLLELYLKPKQGWEKLKDVYLTIPELYKKYIVFFAFIPAVSHFIGFTLFRDYYVKAIQTFLEMAQQDKEQPLMNIKYMQALLRELQDNDIIQEALIMLTTYGFELFKPVVFTILIFFLSPAFGGIKDPNRSFMVATFALIPSWVAGIFYTMNSPISMFFIFLGTFYTFYLVFIGAEKVLDIPSEKSKNFQFIIVFIILYLVISGVIGQIETLITYRILGV